MIRTTGSHYSHLTGAHCFSHLPSDIACGADDFSTLCTAVQAAGLGDALSEGHWTVFAPTNEAFANLGDTLDAVLADKALLTDILLFHAVDDVVGSDDLVCNTGGGNGLVEMANGQVRL